jgi:anaphase-promoting complex subunit 1
LVQEHDATTLGVLVGTAAARRGTMNPDASKMCFLHLPTRHPARGVL